MYLLCSPPRSGAAPGLCRILRRRRAHRGDIKDPHSRISQMLHEHHDTIKVLKPESGTSPHVFYLGLDEAFVTPLIDVLNPLSGRRFK